MWIDFFKLIIAQAVLLGLLLIICFIMDAIGAVIDIAFNKKERK